MEKNEPCCDHALKWTQSETSEHHGFIYCWDVRSVWVFVLYDCLQFDLMHSSPLWISGTQHINAQCVFAHAIGSLMLRCLGSSEGSTSGALSRGMGDQCSASLGQGLNRPPFGFKPDTLTGRPQLLMCDWSSYCIFTHSCSDHIRILSIHNL